jgi:hypothetical protein
MTTYRLFTLEQENEDYIDWIARANYDHPSQDGAVRVRLTFDREKQYYYASVEQEKGHGDWQEVLSRRLTNEHARFLLAAVKTAPADDTRKIAELTNVVQDTAQWLHEHRQYVSRHVIEGYLALIDGLNSVLPEADRIPVEEGQ